jgi:hypothetical protein
MNRRTLSQRLLYHHLPLAVASAACCLLVFTLAKTKYLPFRLSMATADTGTLLLCVTLVLGVLKVVRGETSPVSTDWRRDVGICRRDAGLRRRRTSVTVVLNGKTIIPGAQIPNLPERGRLALQHHGSKRDGRWTSPPALVQFKNIFIRELNPR